MTGRVRLAATITALALVFLSVLAFLGKPSGAQTPPSAPTGAVTVFTDGLAYPDGVISKALAELSAEMDKSGKPRMLSIMGNGGAANVRDLLRFRGADFAILNSDVFGSAEIAKAYPEAFEKLRYVTRLRSQKAVLLARGDISSVDRLAGKKVLIFGPNAMAGLTARNVFTALGVNADIAAFQEGAESQLQDASAIFFFKADIKRLPASVIGKADFRPIAIPMNPALAKTYRAGQILPGELTANFDRDAIATIETDTILASFNWVPTHARYLDVTAFIDKLFALVPQLRKDRPTSIWNETDPRAPVLGWRQYPHAAAASKSVPPPPALPPIATTPVAAAPAATAPLPPVATSPAAAAAPSFSPSGERMRTDQWFTLSIVPQPPLTDDHASGGGLLTELAKAVLERTDWPHAADLEIRWNRDRASQTHGLLDDKRTEHAILWAKPNCDDPEFLTGDSAALCDGALTSEPIFKALAVFFTRSESDFDPSSEDRLSGRALCIPASRDVAPLSEKAKQLVRAGKLKLVRPQTLIDCLNVVGQGEADALLLNELEGRRAISDLGLSQSFRVIDNAGTAQEIRLVVSKEAPKAQELVAALNKAIAKLKAEELYSQIVMKNLMPFNRSATAR